MSSLNLALVAAGGLVLGLGLISGFLRQHPISDPIVALSVGVFLGPAMLGLLNISEWGEQTILLEETSRLSLAISLMGVALRLPKGYFKKHWRSLGLLLGLLMPLMWFCSGLLVYGFLDLPFWVALLVGAVVTPTDPIVATSIVTGRIAEKHLPKRLRYFLSAESGANDGLAYPIVLLPILVLTKPPASAVSQWLLHAILWEVGFAILFGAFLGYGAGWLLQRAEAKQTIDKRSFLSYTLALSLLTLGATRLLGSDGILAVFVAGLAFDYLICASERAEEERVQEAVDRFFTLPIFLLLGLALPWSQWWQLGWRGGLLAIAILLLRRIPALFVLSPFTPELKKKLPDTLFLGWFGPIGIAALYYANFAIRHTGFDQIWAISSLVISASIIAHGVSATPLTKLYGKQVQYH
jgi:NhaP-type Na+/H+ or K+/H+ antiporter